jgi:hypothetical protein
MKSSDTRQYIALFSALIFATIACGLLPGSTAPKNGQPDMAISSISIGGDLTQVDVCKAIPEEDIVAIMGLTLSKNPQHYVYDDTPGESGCWYEAAKDSTGEAHFGYVVFTPVDTYNSQPLYKNVDVSGLGQTAYFNNGADARQLWVKVSDKTAFVIAFGDMPVEDGSKALAKLLLVAIH